MSSSRRKQPQARRAQAGRGDVGRAGRARRRDGSLRWPVTLVRGWSRHGVMVAGTAAVAGIVAVASVLVLAGRDVTLAANGATPEASWLVSSAAVSGPLATKGLPGTASAVEYAFGLDYAGDRAGHGGSGVAMSGSRIVSGDSSGGSDAPVGLVTILQGDTLTGSAAAWNTVAGPGVSVAALGGSVDAAGALSVVSPGAGQSVPDGVSQARWQIAAADAATINGGTPTAPTPVTLRATRQTPPDTGNGVIGTASDGTASDGTEPDDSVHVLVAKPALSATVEACTTGTECDRGAAVGKGGWSGDGILTQQAADAGMTLVRVTAINSGNVEMDDVRVATAQADTADLSVGMGDEFGDLAAGMSRSVTFPVSVSASAELSASVSGSFAGDGPDGKPLAGRFTDAAGVNGRVPSAVAAATLRVDVAPATAGSTASAPSDPAPPATATSGSPSSSVATSVAASASAAVPASENASASENTSGPPSLPASGSSDAASSEVSGFRSFLSAAGITALDAPLTGASAPLVVQQVQVGWTSTTTPVPNNSNYSGVAYTNVNTTTGTGQGTQSDTVITLVATNGVWPALPAVCLTDTRLVSAAKVSSISADGKTLYCNVGTASYGTAVAVPFTVVASGANGAQLQVTEYAGYGTTGTSVNTTQIPISAGSTGIDVVMDTSFTVPISPTKTIAAGTPGAAIPFGLRVPSGAAWPSGTITFTVTVTNNTITNAVTAISIGSCQPYTSGSAADLPASAALFPSSCTVTSLGSGNFRVTLSGYSVPPTAQPAKAANGSTLPAGYGYFATGQLTFSTTAALSTNPGSFKMAASALTVGGTATTEASPGTGNNTATVTVSAGSWTAELARNSLIDYAPWGNTSGPGGRGAAYPGQHISTYVSASSYAGLPVTNLTAIPFCEGRLGPVTFDGLLAYPWSSYAAGATAKFYYTTNSAMNLTATGNMGTNCTTVDNAAANSANGWTQLPTPTTYTEVGSSRAVADFTAATYNHTAWTGVKVVLDYSHSTLGVMGNATAYMYAGYQVNSTATAGQFVYATSTTKVADSTGKVSAAWYSRTASSGLTTAVASEPIFGGYVNVLEDFAQVVSWAPLVSKSASPSVVNPGEPVSYVVKVTPSGLAGTSVTVPVADSLPLGMSYVAGSAKVQIGAGTATATQPSVTAATSTAGQQLAWSVASVPVNTAVTVTYQGVPAATAIPAGATSAVLTNTASSTAPGLTTPVSASASVTVASSSETVLLKQAGTPTVVAGQDGTVAASVPTWTLSLSNVGATAQPLTDIIDVLPYNGDGRGSSFGGSFHVNSVFVNEGERLYYTTAAPSGLSNDPAVAANGGAAGTVGGTAGWTSAGAVCGGAAGCTFTLPTSTNITAFRITGGTLAVSASRVYTVSWYPVGEIAGDVYANSAGARTANSSSLTGATQLLMLSGDTITAVTDGSKLQVDKAFSAADSWVAGGLVRYTLTVKNSGTGPAYQVKVTDNPSTNLATSGAQWSAVSQGSTNGFVWSVGTLAAGASATASVAVPLATVDRTKNVVNWVQASNPSNPSPSGQTATNVQANDSVGADTDQADVVSTPLPPQLVLTKALGSARAVAADQFTVAIRTGGVSGTVVSATTNSTTTGSGATVTSGSGTSGTYTGAAGTAYTVTETMSGASGQSPLSTAYSRSLTCTNVSGAPQVSGLPSGSTLAMTGSTAAFTLPALTAGANVSCVITNTAALATVYLFKTGIRSGSASGAGDFTGGLDGSAWQILDDDGGSPGAAASAGVVVAPVSGTAGLFKITGLIMGTSYWLTETRSPSGYELLAQPVRFTVNSDGSVTMGANAGSGNSATVTAALSATAPANGAWVMTAKDVSQWSLPSAGGSSTDRMVQTGAGLLGVGLIAGLMLMIVERRRKSD